MGRYTRSASRSEARRRAYSTDADVLITDIAAIESNLGKDAALDVEDILDLIIEVKHLREKRYCDVWPTCSTCSEHNREYGYPS